MDCSRLARGLGPLIITELTVAPSHYNTQIRLCEILYCIVRLDDCHEETPRGLYLRFIAKKGCQSRYKYTVNCHHANTRVSIGIIIYRYRSKHDNQCLLIFFYHYYIIMHIYLQPIYFDYINVYSACCAANCRWNNRGNFFLACFDKPTILSIYIYIYIQMSVDKCHS